MIYIIPKIPQKFETTYNNTPVGTYNGYRYIG